MKEGGYSMAYVKLTAKNQTALFLDDAKRAGKWPLHYSIGEHILSLSRRLDALEAQGTLTPSGAETVGSVREADSGPVAESHAPGRSGK